MRPRILTLNQWLAIAVLALFVASVAAFRFWKGPDAPDPAARPVAVVEVQGEVRRPGVHLLPAEISDVAGALQAAGGTRGGGALSDETAYRLLESGETVVFRRGPTGAMEAEIRRMDGVTRLALGLKLDPNRASAEALDHVPWMREDTAGAIVARRREKAWSSLEELQEISGVGPKTVDRWRDYLEIRK
jgi:competence protein ComEA